MNSLFMKYRCAAFWRKVLLLWLLILLLGNLCRGQEKTNIRELLLRMTGANFHKDSLAVLFRVGDEQISELIGCLDDPNEEVSNNAQKIIRYLGNDEGMSALLERYEKAIKENKSYVITLPIPLPLREWDYSWIKRHYMGTPPIVDGLEVSYFFALALDNSPKADLALAEISKHWEGYKVNHWVLSLMPASFPTYVIDERGELAKSVLKNTFFLNVKQNQADIRLIAYNGSKNKALIEIVNGRFPLETRYHIVVYKIEKGWQFYSISLVAES